MSATDPKETPKSTPKEGETINADGTVPPVADPAPEVKVGEAFASFRRSTAQKAKNVIHKPAVAKTGRVLGRIVENAVTAGGAILILGAGANVVNRKIGTPEPVIVTPPRTRPRPVPNESSTQKTA